MDRAGTTAQGPRKGALTRRAFFLEMARSAGIAGMAGMGLWMHSRTGHALPVQGLRPPGALPEQAFLGTCIRCGLCVRDCPFDTLRLVRSGEDGVVGTPYFKAREVPCEMCPDIPCVVACPTGALDPALKEIDDARMGLAVLSDQENCLNFLGLRCEVCYRVCPLIDKAITLERGLNTRTGRHAIFLPVVHSDSCTGCGKCERSCVLDEAAIRVLPWTMVKGEIGSHYRLGWEEQEKAGGPLVPNALKNPIGIWGSELGGTGQ